MDDQMLLEWATEEEVVDSKVRVKQEAFKRKMEGEGEDYYCLSDSHAPTKVTTTVTATPATAVKASQSPFCYLCKESGHETKSCLTLKCKRCGEMGHAKIRCPLRKRRRKQEEKASATEAAQNPDAAETKDILCLTTPNISVPNQDGAVGSDKICHCSPPKEPDRKRSGSCRVGTKEPLSPRRSLESQTQSLERRLAEETSREEGSPPTDVGSLVTGEEDLKRSAGGLKERRKSLGDGDGGCESTSKKALAPGDLGELILRKKARRVSSPLPSSGGSAPLPPLSPPSLLRKRSPGASCKSSPGVLDKGCAEEAKEEEEEEELEQKEEVMVGPPSSPHVLATEATAGVVCSCTDVEMISFVPSCRRCPKVGLLCDADTIDIPEEEEPACGRERILVAPARLDCGVLEIRPGTIVCVWPNKDDPSAREYDRFAPRSGLLVMGEEEAAGRRVKRLPMRLGPGLARSTSNMREKILGQCQLFAARKSVGRAIAPYNIWIEPGKELPALRLPVVAVEAGPQEEPPSLRVPMALSLRQPLVSPDGVHYASDSNGLWVRLANPTNSGQVFTIRKGETVGEMTTLNVRDASSSSVVDKAVKPGCSCGVEVSYFQICTACPTFEVRLCEDLFQRTFRCCKKKTLLATRARLTEADGTEVGVKEGDGTLPKVMLGTHIPAGLSLRPHGGFLRVLQGGAVGMTLMASKTMLKKKKDRKAPIVGKGKVVGLCQLVRPPLTLRAPALLGEWVWRMAPGTERCCRLTALLPSPRRSGENSAHDRGATGFREGDLVWLDLGRSDPLVAKQWHLRLVERSGLLYAVVTLVNPANSGRKVDLLPGEIGEFILLSRSGGMEAE